MSPPGALVRLLSRGRLPVAVGLFGAVALAWLYLVTASLDMYGPMDGISAWMMRGTWDAQYFLLVFLMWTVMMVGMMVPSATPAILLYAALVPRQSKSTNPTARTCAFVAGYFAAWTGFSLGATVMQWWLAQRALLSPMMESASPAFGAAMLVAAGLYQWSPLKSACLTQCRSPLAYLSRHWRPGVRGALHMGARHGLYCVGCCWALMLLLFVGGVMSLLWIAALAVFVLLEKLAPFGVWSGRIAGAALITAGVLLLLFAA